MPDAKVTKLRDGHRKALGLANPAQDKPLDPALERYYKRHELLRGLSSSTIRKAWFTMAHLLLQPGARVADMGSNDGAMTYAMAALNPQIEFIGIDIDRKKVSESKQKWKLPNLDFQLGDIARNAGLKDNSLDAIINSFILHEVYSSSRYHDRPVVNTIEQHFDLLKPEGLMFVRDHALQQNAEYVLLEMPDRRSQGLEIEQLSEPDLLLWYSEHARPREDPGSHGFFVEELPPRFPQTRLFRLPYKWAYEFIVRKDNRARLKEELLKEYSFFTERDFRKHMRAMGARVVYSTPHWDEAIIRERYDGHFRLYGDDGTPLPPPPTSFLIVAQKMGERRSLVLQERRPAHKANPGRVRITAMRNEITGKIVDVVSRDADNIDIIPYRITPEGLLNVFVHEGIPRGIVNSVPRSGRNLDGRGWSGHMTEAISMPGHVVRDIPADNFAKVTLFARDHLGLKPTIGSKLEPGPFFYPAPEYIDERIETRYLNVEARDVNLFMPRHTPEDIRGFTTTGRIREVSAQSVLDAMSVGIIPNARLEQQIFALYEMLGMKAEFWNDCPLVLAEDDAADVIDLKDVARRKSGRDSRYKNIKGTTGHLRTIQSIFVDEGWVEGSSAGLASRDMEFVISDENTVNKAVVLPLTRDLSGEVLGGFILEHLPIPQRYTGNGLTVSAPSFVLPREITNLEMARRYLAEKFEVPVHNIARMGESFYLHTGLTPERIFPFVVTGVPKGFMLPIHGATNYAPLSKLGKLLWWDKNTSFMRVVAYAYRRFCDDGQFTIRYDFDSQPMGNPDTPVATVAEDLRGVTATETPLPPRPAKDEKPEKSGKENKKRLDPR